MDDVDVVDGDGWDDRDAALRAAMDRITGPMMPLVAPHGQDAQATVDVVALLEDAARTLSSAAAVLRACAHAEAVEAAMASVEVERAGMSTCAACGARLKAFARVGAGAGVRVCPWCLSPELEPLGDVVERFRSRQDAKSQRD